MTSLQSTTVLVGRVLLGLIFVLSGFAKISGFEGTAGYIASKGLPLPQLVAALAIVIELGGGLALMAGLYTRQVVVALAAFSILAGFIFHNFWAMPQAEQMANQINVLKNLAIAGGMLVVAAFGPGRLSLDARRLAAA